MLFLQDWRKNMNVFDKAREFMYYNARPLDLARWQYHFEDGSKEAVLNALSYYQNADGGFGHGIEEDCWNPYSSPIQTWCATEILKEIDFDDSSHPIIKGILNYLESKKDFSGHIWYNVVDSNNDYPHAQWWHFNSANNCQCDYNPTASLAGFIVRFAPTGSELYKLGVRIVQEAFESYMNSSFLEDMHTVTCFLNLLHYLEKADSKLVDITTFRDKLKAQVKYSITKDKILWEKSYICKPSQFFNRKDSIFYIDNKDIVEYECDYIIKTQLDDGSWNIPWSWKNYPEEWAISKNWWKGNVTIVNMLYLKGMEKI